MSTLSQIHRTSDVQEALDIVGGRTGVTPRVRHLKALVAYAAELEKMVIKLQRQVSESPTCP